MNVNDRINQGWGQYATTPPAPGSTLPTPPAQSSDGGSIWSSINGFFSGLTNTATNLLGSWADVQNAANGGTSAPPAQPTPTYPTVQSYRSDQSWTPALMVGGAILVAGLVVLKK